MQYFTALSRGKERVAKAREYLGAISGGEALPALALHDTKTSSWEPVGEEMHYAFVSDAPGFVLTDGSGYLLALVDKTGTAKAIVQNIMPQKKAKLVELFEADGISEFQGNVILPV